MDMGDRSELPLPTSNYSLSVVLIGVSHPGNLGAVCRAMLNYGFVQLRLVQPQCDPNDIEARNRACLLYTSPSPRDKRQYRMPSSA